VSAPSKSGRNVNRTTSSRSETGHYNFLAAVALKNGELSGGKCASRAVKESQNLKFHIMTTFLRNGCRDRGRGSKKRAVGSTTSPLSWTGSGEVERL